MKLDPALREHYWDKGWVVVESVFAPADAERVAQRALEVVAVEIGPESAIYKVDRSADGKQVAPRKLDTPFEKDQTFGRLVAASPLPDLLEQLLGVPVLLHTDSVFFKPPHHGSPKAYHQDNAYFRVTPADHMVTAWIALDDVDEENGCLRYIDESHKGPILESKVVPGVPHDLTPDPSLYDIRKESLARVKKGGVVFHHANALHSSGPNASPRWRRGYATHWISAQGRSEGDVVDGGYYRRRPDLFEAIGVAPTMRAGLAARG